MRKMIDIVDKRIFDEWIYTRLFATLSFVRTVRPIWCAREDEGGESDPIAPPRVDVSIYLSVSPDG